MVMDEASVNNIMSGIENTGGVLHNRKKLRQRFDIIKKLGQGTYGKVQLGINKETGQEVAIKTIKKCKIESSADLIRIRREVQIMSSVRHPNIIHIYEVFENREKMVLVMEYAAGGELYDYLSSRKVLPEEEARRIFRQIATAIYYCHKHKICHRDLKLENILLDEHGSAKIADFGLSNVFAEQRLLSTYCGSPLYASPEIVTGTPYNGPEVDCWSLGVLLYTMVYGAMPFDGTHFKTLVKQISMGDYFEPKKKSPASSLIREMLTVCPKARADVEKICSHWWVNVNHDSSCLDIAEELASQTPVRLDLLLSLAPPAVDSEKLVVTEDQVAGAASESLGLEAATPMISRSQSADSVMDMGMPGDRRMMDIMSGSEATIKPSATKIITPSVDIVESVRSPKRKKAVEENNSTETVSKAQKQNSKTGINSIKDKTEAVVPIDPEVPEEEGAMCIELLDKRETKKPVKKKTEKQNATTKATEVKEKLQEQVENKAAEVQKEETKEIVEEKQENATKPRKILKKKVKPETSVPEKIVENEPAEMEQENEIKAVPKERRKSRIMEKAEKFMTPGTTTPEIKPQPSSPPKKILIPGVNVGEYRQSFERRASLNSTPPQSERKQSLTSDKVPDVENKLSDENLAKESEVVLNNIENLMNHLNVEEEKNQLAKEGESVIESNVGAQEKLQDATPAKSVEKSLQNSFSLEDAKKSLENSISLINNAKNESNKELNKTLDQTEKSDELTKEQRVKNAVETISNAIPRMCMGNRKPPFAYGAFGRSSSLGPAFGSTSPSLEKLKVQVGPGDVRTVSVDVSTPEANLFPQPIFSGKANVPNEIKDNTPVREKKKSTCEVVLSSTLPRRKTSTAEIKLSKPQLPNVPMSFKTEVEHRVGDLRSAPVRSPPGWTPQPHRAASLEPDQQRNNTKERIIPIQVNPESNRPPAYQRTTSNSFRSGSLSRQSTLESDSEIPTSPGTPNSTTREPIRKSPREVIIPIAIEGGGYVTPRSGSVEPSETSSRTTSRVGRAHRMGSIINDRDSEDESTFGRLHRHSSIGRDSDGEDGRFHLHRLRSSRPTRGPVEPSDSVSSGEDDDEDCFEILTAENLFSTLLSRVRSLTQRLNVEDDGRPGFPSSRLLGSGFGSHVPFWEREPSLTRRLNGRLTGPSWHRSMSREMGSDVGSVFSDRSQRSPSGTSTLPRGKKSKKHNRDASFDASYTDESSSLDLDLNDLDLSGLKLSQSDLDALSSLTPSLSRRIQNQLLAKLPPTQARKLSRTLSMRNSCAAEDITNPKRINRSFSNSRKINKNEDFKLEVNEDVPASNGNFRRNGESNADDPKYINNDVENRTLKNIPLVPKVLREGSQPKTVSHKKPNSLDAASESSSGVDRFIKEPSPASKISSVRTTPDRYLYGKYSPLSTEDPVKPYSYEGKESTLPRSRLLPRDSKSPSFNLSSALDEIPTLTRRTSVNRGTPQRRISRFLRPDFFDTPRDESIYVKEKREREMETQKVLKEIRVKREQSMDRRSECAETSVVSNNNNNLNDLGTDVSVSCANNKSISEDKVLTNNVNEHVQEKDKTQLNNLNENNNLKVDNSDSTICNKKVKQKSKDSKLTRPKSFSAKDGSLTIVNQLSNSNVKNSDLADINQKTESVKTKESKLIRPKSYPNSKISPPKDILNDRRSIEKESTPPITKNSEKLDKKDKIKSKLKEKSPPKEGLKTVVNGDIDSVSKTENKTKEKSPEKPVKVCKSFLQTIGQKFEKFRSDPKTKSLRKSANADGKSPPKELTKNSTNIKTETKNATKSDEKEKGKVVLNSDRKSPSLTNKTKKRDKVPRPVEVETPSNADANVSQNCNPNIQNNIKNDKGQDINDTANASSLVRNEADTEKVGETKAERKSRIDNVIRSLRERSLPRGPMGLTESGLIKRAVSVEDMSGHLQASRKSVSKVLGLFKKIENKTDETVRKQSDFTNNKRHSDNYEQIKSSNKISSNINSTRLSERPKSLLVTNSNGLKKSQQQYAGAKSDSTLTMTQLEEKMKNDLAGSSKKNGIDIVNGIREQSPRKLDNSDNQNDMNKKINRKSLKLDFSKLPVPKTTRDKSSDPDISENKSSDRTSSDATERLLDTEGSDLNNKSSLLPSDETSSNTAFLSPCDESELTFDNWSDCSDLNTPKTNPIGSPCSDMASPNFDTRSDYNDNHPHYPHINSSGSQLSSPTFDNNNPESIIDRIRRKSFYSRFNEKKQKRKSSLVGAGAAKEYYNKPPIVDHYKYDELGNHKDRSHHHHYSKSHHDTVDSVRSNYRPKSRTDFSKPVDHNIDQYKPFSPKRRDTYCGLDYYNSIDRRCGLNDSLYGRSASIVDRNSYVRSPNIYENHQRLPMDRYRSYGSSDLYGSRDLTNSRDLNDPRSPVLSPVRGYSGYHTYNPRLRRDSAATGRISEVLGDCATEHRSDIEKEAPISSEMTPQTG